MHGVGYGTVPRCRYDIRLQFKSHSAHEVIDAIEAAVPVKQYRFRCRVAKVNLLAREEMSGLSSMHGLEQLKEMEGDAIKLVVDDHGMAMSDPSVFTGRERCISHTHFDFTEILGWLAEKGFDGADDLVVRIQGCDVLFDRFGDRGASAVVQAIEGIVEFKTRVKQKVVGVFGDTTTKLAVSASLKEISLDDIKSGSGERSGSQWKPAPSELPFYE